jgi:hypothetical protein
LGNRPGPCGEPFLMTILGTTCSAVKESFAVIVTYQLAW